MGRSPLLCIIYLCFFRLVENLQRRFMGHRTFFKYSSGPEHKYPFCITRWFQNRHHQLFSFTQPVCIFFFSGRSFFSIIFPRRFFYKKVWQNINCFRNSISHSCLSADGYFVYRIICNLFINDPFRSESEQRNFSCWGKEYNIRLTLKLSRKEINPHAVRLSIVPFCTLCSFNSDYYPFI